MVASLLVGSMILTRRKGYRLFDRRLTKDGLLNDDPDSARSSDDLIARDYTLVYDSADDVSVDAISTGKQPPKKRRCLGATIYTPNTSRFAGHFQSRVLQSSPF